MDGEQGTPPDRDMFDIGSLFRTSATVTFVIEIVAVIVMVGALAAYGLKDVVTGLGPDIQVLLLLVGSIITLMVFLAAMGVFVRFSRKISNMVVGPGIQQVPMDTPRVRAVVYTYGLLVALMAITGLYVFYLTYKNWLFPLAEAQQSIALHVFSFAVGAFFVALLVQIIIAAVGRTATRVVLEVLNEDDSEFID